MPVFPLSIIRMLLQFRPMPTRASKSCIGQHEKINSLAARIVEQTTGQPIGRPKNAAAVALGRLGASKGGLARSAKLSKDQRKAIAKKAAKARWAKTPP